MKNLVKHIASFLLLLLLSCAAFAQSIVQVEIDSVDFGNSNISVTHDGKLRKLAVASNAEITIEGKRADLATLMPGNTASITYDKNVGAVTKIAAQRAVILPAEKLAEGWGQIDDRLIFLMVRLASTEASLEAIDNALIASNRNQARKAGQAKQADKKSENMDRMGGGPIPWATFYGRTAESFFYHPTDRNTSYHTETILSQQAPSNDNQSAAGVPSRQGLPVHQRPPQFDYLYRANETAKARAEYEIGEMKGKVELLAERKRNLEAEQAGLWCEVAFRSVSHYDLDKKPLYRFEPILSPSADSDARYQFKTISGAASFMALGLSIVETAQKDQSTTFSKIKPAVAKARQDLNDTWLRIGVDVTDRKTTEGKFNALAKRLEESASNLSDSYVVAMEGDMANDQQRKYMFRGLLQESLIRYAETILALDEMATLMKDDWNVKPDIDTPIKFVSLSSIEASRAVQLPKLGRVAFDSDFDSPNAADTSNDEPPKRPKHIPADAVFWKGSWYWFSQNKASFREAALHAIKSKGQLMTIESWAENEFVGSQVHGPTFIGILKQNNRWLTGDGVEQRYFNWDKAGEQPSSYEGENVAAIHKSGLWYDWGDTEPNGGPTKLLFAIEWKK
jgi:hypothetical protein